MPDARYISLKNLIKTGNIISKEFAFYEVPFKQDVFDNATFQQTQIDFYATITNLNTAQAEYIKLTDPLAQMEVLRATSAMPYVSTPVEINGIPYLDGAIADSIPLEQMKKMGYDKIIVVLTRTLNYRKSKPNPLLAKLWYRKYPKFAEAVNNRYAMYNEQVESIIEQEKKSEIFCDPPFGRFKRKTSRERSK